MPEIATAPATAGDWSHLIGTTWRYPWGDVFRIHAVLWDGHRRAPGIFIFDSHGRGPNWVPIVCLEHLMDGCEPVKLSVGGRRKYEVDAELLGRLREELDG